MTHDVKEKICCLYVSLDDGPLLYNNIFTFIYILEVIKDFE